VQQDLPDAFGGQPKLPPDIRQRLALLTKLVDLAGTIGSDG
jgi:hypothetical protein